MYKKFRKDDARKMFPVLFERNNYGFSPIDISQSDVTSKKMLRVSFPASEFFTVFLIRVDTEKPVVEDVKIAGLNSDDIEVGFEIEDGKEYNILVMSKNYSDGYISEDYSISKTQNMNITYQLINDGEIASLIRLEVQGRMTKSYNQEDSSDWYNYGRSYIGPLVWQYDSSIDIDANYSYIIPKKEILTTMKMFFETLSINDIGKITYTYEGIYALKCLSDIYYFLRSDYVTTYKDRYPEINSFVTTMNNFIMNVSDDLLDINSSDDTYAKYYVYAEKKTMMDNYVEYNWNSRRYWGINGGQGTNHKREFYDDIHDKRNKFSKENIKWGGLEVYDVLDAFVNRDDVTASYRDTLGDHINDYLYDRGYGQYKISDFYFESINVPHDSTVVDNRGVGIPNYIEDSELIQHITFIGHRVLFQIRDYINQELLETRDIINNLGDFIFNRQSSFDPSIYNLSEYSSMVEVVQTALSDISEYALANGYSSNLELFGGDENIGLDEISRARTSINNIVEDISDPATQIDNLPILITNTIRARSFIIEILNLMLDDEVISDQTRTIYLEHLGDEGTRYYASIYDYYANYSEEVDGGGGQNLPSLAHEAILQNIRFINTVLNSGVNDIFYQVGSSVSTILDTIKSIKSSIDSSVATFTISNKIESIPSVNIIDYSMEKYCDKYNVINQPMDMSSKVRIRNFGENTYVQFENLSDVGKYRLKIYPQKFMGEISNHDSDGIYCRFSQYPEITGVTNNSFYGWNARIIGEGGVQLGTERIISRSSYSVEDGYFMKLTPENASETGIYSDAFIEIWSNAFETILYDIDIVEHDDQSLSYSMYSKQEFNTDTGVLTLYDYAGNVYKTFSVGQRALPSEGNSIIEFKEPTG
jgi:hypothetical protein